MPTASLNGDPPEFGEFLEGRTRAEPPEAAVTYTPEWHPRLVVHGRPIDVADAGFDPLGQFKRGCHIRTEDCARQSVAGVVRDLDRGFLRIGRDDGRDRPEGLLAIYPHF